MSRTTRITAALLPLLVVATTLVGLLGPSVQSAAAFTLPSPGNIGPIAGSGTGGDGGAATSASLNAPGGVAVDGAGNTYITETNGNRVRRVDGSTGIITTVAGSGTVGYSGDGGPATSAALNGPEGVAINGNFLYIADTGNGAIRRVDLGAGTITTYMGLGAPTAALQQRLATPWGVTFNGAFLYVVEFGGRKVWKVNDSSATVFAGTGVFTATGTGGDGGSATSATFKTPTSIAFDGSGNAYISDTIDGRVRKVNSAGIISNFAGTPGTNSFAGDNGPATSATLFQPYGVAVRTVVVDGSDPNPVQPNPPITWSDTYQTVVIADTQNARIRYVPLAALGSPHPGTVNPDSASCAVGNICTALGNGTKVSGGDGGPAHSATTKDPRSIATQGGNVFIGEAQGNRVRKLTAITAATTNPPQPPDATTADVALPNVNVSTMAGNGTATLAGDGGPATNAGLANPQGVSFTPAGDLLIADTNNQAIRLVNAQSGTITTVAGTGVRSNPPAVPLGDGGPATQATLNFPAAAAENAAGDIFIADTFNNVIRKVDHASGNISTFAGTGTRGFAGDGGLATAAQLNQPFGVVVDGAGNVVVTDTVNQRIRIIGLDGKINTIVGSGNPNAQLGDGGPATAANISYPTALTIDAMGTYVFADSGHNLVRRAVPNGNISTIAGGGNSLAENVPALTASLPFVSSVAVDAYGELFVADITNNRVRRVNTNGTIVTVAGVPGATPGNGGYSGDGGAGTAAQLKGPFSVAVDPTGSLFIADTGNSRVRAVAGAQAAGVTVTAKYVTAAYHDFVNAAPTPAQLEAGVLRSDGASPYQFVIDLANSPQWLTNIVTQFYENTLGRQPDAGGLAFWINALQTKTKTVAQAASDFYASLEYYNKVGGTDGLWVDDLYNKLLHRTPDQAGHDFWVGQVAQIGRGVVAFEMYQSQESAQDRVTDVYEVRCGPGQFVATCPSYRPLLNRAPDGPGLQFWSGQVIQQGDIVLAAALGSSPEYITNAQSRTFP